MSRDTSACLRGEYIVHDMHRDTAIVHAGYADPHSPGSSVAGPQFVSTFTTPGDPAVHPLTYGRFHNPTWTAWESALSVLEGGDAVAYASGMAAIMAVFGTTLKPGSVLVMPSDCYYTTRVVGSSFWQSIGVDIRMAPTRDTAQMGLLEGATLLWIETPSNPQLDVCDIRALTAAAASKGVLTAVDNTTATAYLQQPLLLGATFAMASDTKMLTGHSDLLLGHVATKDADRLAALRTWRTQHGAIPGPMEVWLAHRSLATLPLRAKQQCDSAMRLATMLRTRQEVDAVHYPGLSEHSGHVVAAGQMTAFGCVVSFDLGSRERAESFLEALTIVREATSFGGVHSSAERRARWGGDAIGEGFIRFSVGCEPAEDLLQDVAAALEKSVSTSARG